jgi:outer membrane protein assembly factor BamB
MNADAGDREVFAILSISGRQPVRVTGPVTIGRDPRSVAGDVIVVDGDPLVSKSHLAVDVEAGQLVVTDLGSSNGTFIHHAGDESAVPFDGWVPLPPGSEVEFGDQRMAIEPVPPVEHTDRGETADVDPQITCGHCGRELPVDSSFCDGCGTPTSSNAPATPAHTNPWEPAAAPPLGPPATPYPAGPPTFDPNAAYQQAPPGAPIFVDPDAPSDSSRGGPAKLILAGVGGVLLIGLIGFALVAVIGSDDRVDSQGPRTVPETLDEMWSQSVAGATQSGAVDGDLVFVTSLDPDDADADAEITAFDRETGDEVWKTRVDAAASFTSLRGVSDGVLVVSACERDCALVGVDAETGAALWTGDVGEVGGRAIADRIFSIENGTIELLDPRTGDRIERVRGDDVRFDGDFVLVTDGDDIEVFDLDLESVLGPERVDRADAFAFDGSHLLVAEGDELRFIETDGEVAMETTVDVGRIDEIHPVEADNIVLSTDEGIISIEPADGEADERWSERGEIDVVEEVDGGAVVVVGSRETLDIVDADTGDLRFDRDLVDPDDGFTVAGRNALVIYDFGGFDGPIEVSAFDWEEGDALWDERFDGFATIDDGLLVELGRDGDVVLYG